MLILWPREWPLGKRRWGGRRLSCFIYSSTGKVYSLNGTPLESVSVEVCTFLFTVLFLILSYSLYQIILILSLLYGYIIVFLILLSFSVITLSSSF